MQGIAKRTSLRKTGATVQAEVLDYLKQHKYIELGFGKGDIVAYKIEMANERGVADILACVRGRFLAMEVKGTGDQVTPIQVAQAKRIVIAGGESYVIKSINDAKEALKKFIK